MTVGAAHAHPEHLALDERAVLEVLVEDLAVGLVDALVEEDRQVVVEQLRAAVVVVAELGPPRVAGGAELDQRPVRDPRGAHHEPGVVERRAPHRRHLGPGDVARAGAVAGLAGDVHLRPGGRVGVALRVVALDQVGRVALGAHAVPVLAVARPVQPVGGRDRPARIEEEPAPPLGVPGDRERLHPAAREADQVLLQRLPAEGVRDFVRRRPAVGAVGLDQEPAALAEEARPHPVALETDAREVAAHGLRRRLGHRLVVVRAGPGLRLLLVTAGARLPPDEGRLGGDRALRRGRAQRLADEMNRTRRDDRARGDERGQLPAREAPGHALSPG